MLGWVRTNGVDGVARDFYVRQLWDGKGSAIVEAMKPSAMAAYARLCGWTLARAHARSGDPVAIASYLGLRRPLRPRPRDLRRGVRRPERAGLRSASECGRQRAGRGSERLSPAGCPGP